jgi:hypothetical protein
LGIAILEERVTHTQLPTSFRFQPADLSVAQEQVRHKELPTFCSNSLVAHLPWAQPDTFQSFF